MQGRGGTGSERDQQPYRQEVASSHVREEDEATHAMRGTAEVDTQGADLEHAAAEGAETQENPTMTPAQAAKEHRISTTTSVGQGQDRGTAEVARTPLQTLQDALKKRFGSDILKTTSSSRPGTSAVSGSVQRR
jgi:hypothetical protein